MSEEYRCRFRRDIRKILIDHILDMCHFLFDEGFFNRLLRIEKPYKIFVEDRGEFKINPSNGRVYITIAYYDYRTYERKRVVLWHYWIDYYFWVEKGNVDDWRLIEKAIREISYFAVKVLEGVPLAKLADYRLVDGEIRGEVKSGESGIPIEFKTTKEFFHGGSSNLEIWFTKGGERKVELKVSYERWWFPSREAYRRWLLGKPYYH